jgi:hypothetical protein
LAKKKLSKGPKQIAAKGRKKQRQEEEITRSINRKNEAITSARALGAGNSFFLKDIKEAGKQELDKQVKRRNKKQANAQKLTDRLQEQLKKLEDGGNV